MIDLATGELAPLYDATASVSCGNRREAVCPACSQVYKRDARQLVRAGLAGGKGIPETITAHPCVFATFTAPSFGPVHSRRMRGKTVLPCRPRRDASSRRCPHGRDISCPTRHMDTIPGSASRCAATATTTPPPCCSTRTRVSCGAGSSPTCPATWPGWPGSRRRRCTPGLRIRFVKVAEYQARGVVHFHAVIRLDAPGDDYQPPPFGYTAALLCDAIGQAAAAVPVAVDHAGPGRDARVRRADRHPDHPRQLRAARHRAGAQRRRP